ADRYPKLREQSLRSGYKSMMVAPLLRDGRAIGALSVLRRTLGAFSEKEQRLLKTFADQAVIAIENMRLINETQEALDQQTATAEVLRVISRSPTDVQPVLDAVAERAQLLCDGATAFVFLREGDLM